MKKGTNMQDEERNSCAGDSPSWTERPTDNSTITLLDVSLFALYSTPTSAISPRVASGNGGSALRFAGSYTRRPSAMGAARARLRASLPRRARLAPLRSPPSFPKPTRGDAGARWLLGSSARAGLPHCYLGLGGGSRARGCGCGVWVWAWRRRRRHICHTRVSVGGRERLKTPGVCIEKRTCRCEHGKISVL